MRITDIQTGRMSVPLKKPFKTALRTVYNAESVIVKLTFDNGLTGWGRRRRRLSLQATVLPVLKAPSTMC